MRMNEARVRPTLSGIGLIALALVAASIFISDAGASSAPNDVPAPEVLQGQRVSTAAELEKALAANPLEFDKPALHQMRCMTVNFPDTVYFLARFLKGELGDIHGGHWEYLFEEKSSSIIPSASAEQFAFIIAAASQIVGKVSWIYGASGFGTYSRNGDRQRAQFIAAMKLFLHSAVVRDSAIGWFRSEPGDCDERTIEVLRKLATNASPETSVKIKDILSWWDGTATAEDYTSLVAAQPARGLSHIARLYAIRRHTAKLAEMSAYLRKKIELEFAGNLEKTDSRTWIGAREMDAQQLFKLGYPEPALLLLKLCHQKEVFFSWWSLLLATMYLHTYDAQLPKHDFIVSYGADNEGENMKAVEAVVDYFVKSGFEKLKWSSVHGMWLAE